MTKTIISIAAALAVLTTGSLVTAKTVSDRNASVRVNTVSEEKAERALGGDIILKDVTAEQVFDSAAETADTQTIQPTEKANTANTALDRSTPSKTVAEGQNGQPAATQKSRNTTVRAESKTTMSAAKPVSQVTKVSETATEKNNATSTTQATTKPTTPDIALDKSLGLSVSDLNLVDHVNTKGKQTRVSGCGTITFAAGQKEQSVSENVFSNDSRNLCFQKYTVKLYDTKEVIASSGLVPPGYRLDSLTLNRALPAGEYKVYISIDCFSFDKEMRTMNGAAFILPLVVK